MSGSGNYELYGKSPECEGCLFRKTKPKSEERFCGLHAKRGTLFLEDLACMAVGVSYAELSEEDQQEYDRLSAKLNIEHQRYDTFVAAAPKNGPFVKYEIK